MYAKDTPALDWPSSERLLVFPGLVFGGEQLEDGRRVQDYSIQVPWTPGNASAIQWAKTRANIRSIF